MCGIIGTFTSRKYGFFLQDKQFFSDLLIVNSLRGAHSTGMFGGKLDEQAQYAKSVGDPYTFLENPATQPILNNITKSFHYVVGHGRHATKGEIKGEFAHPFQERHITMVHNGTVRQSDLVDVNKYVSDSKAISIALANNPPEDVFSDINGAYAIVWHDKNKETLSLVRNKERPLALAVNYKENQVYFASEKNMLVLAAFRNNISFDDIQYIPEDTIITFNKDSINWKEEKLHKKTFFPVSTKPQTKPTIEQTSVAKVTAIKSKEKGTLCKTKEKIRFSITDIVELPNRKAKEYIFQVFGESPQFPEIEISFIWKGDEDTLYKKEFFEGTVSSIVPSSNRKTKEGKAYIVYVYDVVATNLLELVDGSLIDKDTFIEMAKFGCDHCTIEIFTHESKDVLIKDNFIYCPTCSSTVPGVIYN